jgi:O-antigen/teichoic acid export membrane protein
VSLKRQFMWSLAPLVVVTAVNLFSVRLFYKYLGAEMYALWFYVITFSGMFGFADLGMGVAVGRYIGVALGKGDRAAVREYWGTGNMVAVPLLGIMGAAFAAIGAILGPHWFRVAPGHENLLRTCFLIGGGSLFLSYYGQFWNILSQAHLEFRFIGLLRTFITLFQVLPSLVIAHRTGNPVWLVLWTAGTNLLQLCIFACHSRRRYNLGFDFAAARMERAREMAAYTGKTFAQLLFGSFFGSVDRMVLGKLAPAESFNPYTIASNAGLRVQSLSVAIMGPVFHNTSRAVGGQQGASPADVYNRSFDFAFGWFVLAAIGAAVWHPILLRVWLGGDLGRTVEPVFTPIILGFCLTAIAAISGAQLGPLNRMGASLCFNVMTGLLTVAGVYIGWNLNGVVGVAWGFLASRIGLVAQDIYVLRLIKAGGWLASQTWLHLGAQCLTGGIFALCYLLIPSHSLLMLVPAGAHCALVSTWLLRHQLVKFLPGINTEPASTVPEL